MIPGNSFYPYGAGYGVSPGDGLAEHNEMEEIKKAEDNKKNTTENRKIANANGIKRNIDAIQ